MNNTITKLFLVLSILFFMASCGSSNCENCAKCKAPQEELQTLKAEQETLDKNIEVVKNFYQEFFGDIDFSAADRYIGDVYVQHNPAVADGKAPLVEAAKVWLKDAPKTKINFHNAIAQDDLVFVHIVDTDAEGTKHSTMDVFRVTDGKITEHWDAFATFKKGDESANENPLW